MSAYLSGFLIIYLVIIGAIAWHARTGNNEDFFVSGRSRSAWLIGTSIAVSWIDGLYFGWYADLVFASGWSGVFWVVISVAVGLFILSVFAPKIWREGQSKNLYTFPDYFYSNFGLRTGVLVTIANTISMLAWTTALFLVSSQILDNISELTRVQSVSIMFLLTAPYIVFGGFRAVLTTDTFQYIFLFIILGLVLFLAKTNTDTSVLPEFDLMNKEKGWILMTIILVTFWSLISGDAWQRIYAAKSGDAARKGMWFGSGAYLIMASVLSLIFLTTISSAVTLDVGRYDFLAHAIETFFQGHFSIIAVLLLLVSIMSSIDTSTFGAAMGMSNDFLHRLGIISDDKVKRYTRGFSILILGGMAFTSLFMDDVMSIVYIAMSVGGAIVPPVFCALTRFKFNEQTIFYSMLAGLVSYFLLQLINYTHPMMDTLPFFVSAISLVIFKGVSFLKTGKSHA